MEYYSAVKRNEVLTYVTHTRPYVNFENTVLSERRYSQKTIHGMIPLYKMPRNLWSKPVVA